MSARRKIQGQPVRVGSIWANRSPADWGRSVQVEAIEHGYAICRTITNTIAQQQYLDAYRTGHWPYHVRDMRGSISRIRLDRMRPTAEGYTHITDNPEVNDEALAALLLDGEVAE